MNHINAHWVGTALALSLLTAGCAHRGDRADGAAEAPAAAPDAALHPLLARVLTASQALSSGNFDADALAELHAVLARYAELFEETSADQIDSA